MLVNLREKPYYLDDEGVKWVEETLANMTLEEKIGQLFVNMGSSVEEEYLKETVEKYHIGAVRYNPAPAAVVHEQNRILQTYSKIPLLIASNVEGGGNGACKGGTEVGMPIKIGATDDPKYSYEMGRISGIEAAAIGSNLSFAPLVDINMNWRNAIISSRCFANDAQKVLDHALAYFKGASESNFACAMKHWPGDGVDERDQHLSNSVNTLSCEEWDATFGLVYKGMIDAGIQSIMAGHIMLPEYQRRYNPTLKDSEILPASLCKEITTDLLKGQLGFNGMVVTDASHMVGMTCMMERSKMVPTAIAAGCDLFLFFNDMDEDFANMMNGYKEGIITDERLHDAIRRILGLKAHLGLHTKAKQDIVPPVEGLNVVNCEEHQKIAREVSDQSITLVKNRQPEIFPMNPNKTKRILLVAAKALSSGANFFDLLMGGGPKPYEIFAEKLRAEGFEVEIYESPFEKIMKLPPEERGAGMQLYFAGKSPIEEFKSQHDMVITFANVRALGQTVERIGWSMSKGGGEIPWYVHELPVIVIAAGNPFVLADIPQAQTYINTYDGQEQTLEVLVDKLMGRSPFKGTDNVNAYTDRIDTRF